MGDLKHPKIIVAKGFLFLGLGFISAALLLLEAPNWRVAALLLITIWSFCRSYYFAFYVIEHYVDPGFRYAGLTSFLRYFLRKKRDVSHSQEASSQTR